LQEELKNNEGLRIFVARRDAWTGARKVHRNSTRTSSKTLTGKSTSQTDHEPSQVATTEDSTQETSQDEHFDSSTDTDSTDLEDVASEIPIAPPLLPPTNPMRASISSAAYPTIYDKVILQNLAPSCPVNLQDILNACVQGWKRDGEWPPKNGVPEASLRIQRKKGRKLSVAGILGLARMDSKDDGTTTAAQNGSGESGIRKGLSKIFGKKDSGQAVVG